MKIKDRVRVFRCDEKGVPHCIHRGIVIGLGTTTARVWDEKSETDHPQHAEWFTIKSRRLWMEVIEPA